MRIRRIIWFACSDFHSKLHLRIAVHEKLAEKWSDNHKKYLINGASINSINLATHRIAWHERKAEHYRKFLRTH